VVTGLDPVRRKVMCQAVGSLFELGEGKLVVAAGDGQPIRERVGGMLEEIGYGERHPQKLERVIVSVNPIGRPHCLTLSWNETATS
jgi:hypothetical protein